VSTAVDVPVPPPVDTHLHAASDDATRYPRTPAGFGSDWWSRGGHTAGLVASTLQRAGVARGLIVQPIGLYGYDNRYVIDAVRGRLDTLRAVIAVDPGRPDAPGVIAELAASPGVVGVRLFAVGGTDGWVETTRAAAAFEAARAARIPVVLTVFGRHLGPLGGLISGFADVPVALDHCAFPGLAGASVAQGDPLFSMAGAPNVYLKVSSHLLLDAARAGDPADLVDQLAGAFGPHRLMWGSDYPQTSDDYPALVGVAERAARRLGAEERAAFFGGNAAAVF
jgi:predicted TIM-barrel fold metal-dependent hydrolase